MRTTAFLNTLKSSFFIASLLLLGACSSYEIPDDDSEQSIGNGTALVHIKVNAFEFIPFDSRATAQTLGDVSSRLSYAFFNMNGEKLFSTKSQLSTESNYGALNVNLDPGQYVLVTIAHNGTNNCTITSPTEVSFNSNHITDTFISCDTIVVKSGEQSEEIKVERCVAMVRIQVEELLPTNVKQMKFYYTGGSSTLNPSSGFGSKNSRQTEIIDVPTSAYTKEDCIFEIYTFPHETTDTLKLTVSELAEDGTSLLDCEFPQVPVKIGEITRYHGKLSDGVNTSGQQFGITIGNTEWTQTDYPF